MTKDNAKPRPLREVAEELAANIPDPPRSGHDVSNEPRIPKGQSGGGQWTAGDSSSPTQRSHRLANSRTPAPFVDDRGNPILGKDGKPMQRPSDVDMKFFVDQGLAAAGAEPAIFSETPGMTTFADLANFWPRAAWDIQRVGPSGEYISAFRDAANVALGLYGAAAGLPQTVVLEIANQAARLSTFAADDPKSQYYTHLPERNVSDIKAGYRLFESGRLGPSTTK